MKSKLKIISTMMILALLIACSTTKVICIKNPPPAAIIETRPHKPHKKAFWVSGHWEWSKRKQDYIWISGHWAVMKKTTHW